MSDDFSTSAPSNGYDPHKVYTTTTNSKGFSARMRVSMPPEVLAMAAEIAATRKIEGIKTPADMIRDCYVHRMHAYQEMLETSDPVLAARLGAISRREAFEAEVEADLQRRRADQELTQKLMQLSSLNGPGTLSKLRQGLETITTEECRGTLSMMVQNWESRGNGR
jgi:hypothetical protein